MQRQAAARAAAPPPPRAPGRPPLRRRRAPRQVPAAPPRPRGDPRHPPRNDRQPPVPRRPAAARPRRLRARPRAAAGLRRSPPFRHAARPPPPRAGTLPLPRRARRGAPGRRSRRGVPVRALPGALAPGQVAASRQPGSRRDRQHLRERGSLQGGDPAVDPLPPPEPPALLPAGGEDRRSAERGRGPGGNDDQRLPRVGGGGPLPAAARRVRPRRGRLPRLRRGRSAPSPWLGAAASTALPARNEKPPAPARNRRRKARFQEPLTCRSGPAARSRRRSRRRGRTRPPPRRT